MDRIAANYAIDLLRRRKRWRTTELPEQTTLLATAPDQDRQTFSGEVQQRVAQELARLTAKERIAFVLRHWEGLKIQEISELTGASVAATKNHIVRAVRKMRKALSPMVGA